MPSDDGLIQRAGAYKPVQWQDHQFGPSGYPDMIQTFEHGR
jgi:hypothetical protein